MVRLSIRILPPSCQVCSREAAATGKHPDPNTSNTSSRPDDTPPIGDDLDVESEEEMEPVTVLPNVFTVSRHSYVYSSTLNDQSDTVEGHFCS